MAFARLAFIAVLVVFVAVALHTLIESTATHVFSTTQLHSIVKEAVAAHKNDTNPEGVINAVVSKLKQLYPEHIMDDQPFILNVAGGAMGAMKILHCSLSEYIIVFGSPTGTEGHSGRHLADDYFHILFGEQHAAAPGTFLPEIYKPGDVHLMRRWVAKQYRMPGPTWALEYARGDIPSMFPFGLFDSVFSTVDPVTIWETIIISAKGMVHELLMGKI